MRSGACSSPAYPARGTDNIRVARASLTRPSILYLQVAQKAGDSKNEGLNVEVGNIRGGLAAKIAAAGEIAFVTTRREPSIADMMQLLKTKDREAVSVLSAASVKRMTQEGIIEKRVQQAVIDDAQRSAGIKEEMFAALSFSTSVFSPRRGSS